ncbi:chaperone protein DnaJ [Philodulcilactobacillus myokoensis]|uniref:Chaperone protein DnaJ n=1 Tax=Philodulcilactobacillus myokoensis TaxID=2929573 RepID=A0A9W6B1S1_9LACO|nr:molecular chaperone DnaJ [Philodulcilactobacillus myokoensis]GLB46935.1 chaperone protein DnaJ [Philodulcilactobacillus myokoensis]
MASKDYYKILGVSRDASQSDINHAYRRLAAKYHPDINHAPGAEDKFKEINEAHEVLSDKQKRANYDQFGDADASQGGGFGGSGFSNAGGAGGFGNFGGGDFSDIFNSMFGGGRTRRHDPNAPRRGRDLQYNMTIDFKDSIFGKKTKINYQRDETCDTCHGSGAKPGTHPEQCQNCNGTGMVTRVAKTPLGQMQTQSPCPVCHGTGKIIKHKCPTCHGEGINHSEHEIEVNIPAGIDDGNQMRLQGQGEAGSNGGPYGDLFIVFRIRPSKDFRREGLNLYYNQPLTFSQASLGSDVNVKTMYGNVSLKIPAGTQTGTTFKLRGKGVPQIHGSGHGDQNVIVKVDTPKHLNKRQRIAMRAFAEASGELKGNKGKGFFDKMKEAFDK